MNQMVTGPNGVTVITQTIPLNGQHVIQVGSDTQTIPLNGQHVIQVGPTTLQNTLCQIPQALQKFFKGEPKALGVTQILIGIMQFCLAIVLAVVNYSITKVAVIIGVPMWGALIFIISGSLSVAAQNKANMCLVKGSLGMNIVSSVVAFIGIVLLSLDLGLAYIREGCSSYSYPGTYYNYQDCWNLRNSLLMVVQGVNGVLLLLMLLEFGISISTSAFGCKATCCISDSDKHSMK